MPSVELRFPSEAGHVRTARLVAAASARRAGVDGARLDEIRLAVGEACARAVRRCEAIPGGAPLLMRIEDDAGRLLVEVVDPADPQEEDEPVVLALLKGLADTFELVDGPGGPGGRIRLSWLPATGGQRRITGDPTQPPG